MKSIVPIDPLRPYVFFRRGAEKHIKSLYEKGDVFINTVKYFRDCEGHVDRGDPQDSIARRRVIGEAKIKICEVGKSFEDPGSLELNAFEVMEFVDYLHTGNIYCLSAVYGHHILQEKNIDFKTEAFGDTVIAIEPQAFMQRLLAGLKKAGFAGVRHGPVRYYPHNFSGDTGIFGKHERFSHQYEYRFFIPTEIQDPIKINIGPLTDIARVGVKLSSAMTFTDNHMQFFTF